MPPFVLSLIAQGLGLIGNAVLAKGKDVIEQKLGVNIEDTMQTDEGRQKLLQLQNDHEEFLINAAIENRKIDLQDKALDIDNTKDARAMNAAIEESANASWLAKNFPYILDGIIVGGTMILSALLFFKAIPEDNQQIANIVLGTLFALCGTVVNFHRGSSSSSKQKDNTINAMAAGATK